MLHHDEDINTAWIVLDASSCIHGTVFLHERPTSLHNGSPGAGRLCIIVGNDKDRADVVMFLDKVAVSFCPQDKSLDLFFDQRGYLVLDTA